MHSRSKVVRVTNIIEGADWEIILKKSWMPKYRAVLETYRDSGNAPHEDIEVPSPPGRAWLKSRLMINDFFRRFNLMYRLDPEHPQKGNTRAQAPFQIVRVAPIE